MMIQTVVVRSYQDLDRQHCRSLWRELTERHREIYGDQTIGGDQPENYFDKYLSKFGSNRLWVATNDSEVVGMVGLILDRYEAEIEPLIVSKTCRRRGIGTQLVDKVISEARKIGACLNASPVARNEEAIRFFHNLGFKNLGQVQLFIDFRNRTWKPSLELHGCRFDF